MAEPSPPAEPDDAQSLARIEAGDIPVEAQRRLHELRTSGGAFTSDLSTSDFALCHQLGLRPLSQVMGSSVYQVGYQRTGFARGWGAGELLGGRLARGFGPGPAPAGGAIFELDTLSDAWNEARERALGRLAREAREVAADAVVGVNVSAQAQDYGESSMTSGVIEYSVIGTAVRREDRASAHGAGAEARHAAGRGRRVRAPVLTELTVADYAKLVSAGVEPAGIVGWSSVFFASYLFGGALASQSSLLGVSVQNFEMREFTQAFYAGREQVMERMGGAAQALGASGIVGVRISHTISRQSASDWSPAGLIATFHALGTAVHDTSTAQPQAPKPTLDLLS